MENKTELVIEEFKDWQIDRLAFCHWKFGHLSYKFQLYLLISIYLFPVMPYYFELSCKGN